MPQHLDRRGLLRAGAAAASALACGVARAAEPAHDVSFLDDFDELWRTLAERYCFFADKRSDWDRVRALYRPMAATATSKDAFTDVVRRVLAELYDAHTHLSDPPLGAPRWPLYDLMVERAGSAVRIAAVAEAGAASEAGLAIGDTILAIDGRPVEQVVRDLTPRCLTRPDPAADAYVLNVAVAGRRGQGRRFTVTSSASQPRDLVVPLKAPETKPDLEWRRLDNGVGCIVIRSFGAMEVAEAFDRALAELRDAPGLLIDVRQNGGGDTAVARPIMGRFISERKAYALMRRREGEGLSAPWTESVDPRGPFTYTAPVAVLTGHWSGSMAEGFPMGMRDIGRATIVGTRMMGLGAAVFPIRLDRTGLQAQYSAEPVYDTRGRPRWLLRPDVEVRDGDDVLAAGLRALAARLG